MALDLGTALATPAGQAATSPMQPPDNSVTSGGSASLPPAVPNAPLAEPNAPPNPNAINPRGTPAAPDAAPAAPAPHERLLNMIQGLAVGLSAAGKSLATKGQEGGPEDVQKFYAGEQEQKLQASQGATAQQSEHIRQQLMVGQTNELQMHNNAFLASLPDTIAAKHLEVSGEQQKQSIEKADFAAQHGGMNSDQFNTMLASPDPVSGQTGPTAFFTTNAQQQLGAATKILGADDQYVKNLQGKLADPKSTAKDLWTATSQIQNQLQLQEKATAAQTQKEAAAAGSAVGKLSTPEALAAPGAQAAIQAKIDDPSTDPNDRPRLRALLPQAAVAQLNAQTIKEREARNQQLIDQGTPESAGALLANRSLTLSELKTRKVTTAFVDEAIKAAQKIDPTYKAAEAEAQGRIAASPANSQFFGNTDSLLVKGGTLDQLATAYSALGNAKIPAINNLANLRKAALGDGPLAAAYAAQLGVADDYSKVISGGGGSDSARQQALDIMAINLSPAGQASAIAQIRKTIESQRNGRVGTNPYMKDMYPDPSTRQETPGLSGTQPAAPQVAPEGHQIQLSGGGTATKKGGQWINDQTGQVVK